MSFLAKNRTVFSIFVAIIILALGTAAIFWARGFKPDFKKGRIERTGLLVISSVPTAAQVYLDDRLTSATDTSIAFLEPKTYRVKVQKDGFTTWEKDVEIKADLASEIKALLFPLAPEIKPLTSTGATNPNLSPDGTKIVYAVGGERGGLYLMSLSEGPFPFRQSPRFLVKNSQAFDFTKGNFIWGPDSKQLIARFATEKESSSSNLLIDAEKSQQEPRDITASLNATLAGWQQEIDLRAQTQALLAPDSVKDATGEAKPAASPSPSPRSQAQTTLKSQISTLNYYPTGLIFSPDEEKILYKNKDGKYKVFDLKLKREFELPELADFINISWFADSSHLVIAQNPASGGVISIIEADGTNKTTVFSGKFENGFVFAHPAGSRLIILTTLTQQEGSLPNLYSVNLR